MKNSKTWRLIAAVLAALTIVLSMLTLCFAAVKTYSATVNVIVPEGNEPRVYYSATVGSVVSGSITGYTVSLVGVGNAQQPAESLVIYSENF